MSTSTNFCEFKININENIDTNINVSLKGVVPVLTSVSVGAGPPAPCRLAPAPDPPAVPELLKEVSPAHLLRALLGEKKAVDSGASPQKT